MGIIKKFSRLIVAQIKNDVYGLTKIYHFFHNWYTFHRAKQEKRLPDQRLQAAVTASPIFRPSIAAEVIPPA